ncbi:hypothetical protein, partial [Vibrio cholerae]|uniref:hypothetical protein n=1 Tax=Vibrio cholerae TaxID=666 RepID=UPI0039C9F1F4
MVWFGWCVGCCGFVVVGWLFFGLCVLGFLWVSLSGVFGVLGFGVVCWLVVGLVFLGLLVF